jgi:hypothetical protein
MQCGFQCALCNISFSQAASAFKLKKFQLQSKVLLDRIQLDFSFFDTLSERSRAFLVSLIAAIKQVMLGGIKKRTKST